MESSSETTYESFCEWIYCDICGLNPMEEFPGFQRAMFIPHPDERLKYAKATHESPMGHYECGWKIEDEKVHYEFVIPYNAEGKLKLTNLKKNEVISSNFDVSENENDVVSDFLKSGKYEIVYKYKNSDFQMPNKFK